MPHMDMKVIGQRLRILRGEKTQETVATACEISHSSLAMYESGSRTPRDEVKIKLAAYYGKSVHEIFFAS